MPTLHDCSLKDPLESRYTPAALKALESFAVEPNDVELVTRSENVTFRVSANDHDTDFVLRLHRPGYNSIEELESERIWTKALHESGVAVPESFLTSAGQHFVLVDVPGTTEQRYVGMTKWLEGTLLSTYLESTADAKERASCFRRIGEIVATMHNQSTGWKAPPGFTRRSLDLDNLLGEAPFWGRFWEHAELTKAERELLLRARESARDALSTYGARPDNFSLIHSDAHPENIIHNGDDLALIDFDDSAYGWHMYDIASTLLEDRFVADFDALGAALLEGYRRHRPLAPEDVAMLPIFLLVRGMAIMGWFHHRPEHAGSEYYSKVKNWVLEECDSSR